VRIEQYRNFLQAVLADYKEQQERAVNEEAKLKRLLSDSKSDPPNPGEESNAITTTCSQRAESPSFWYDDIYANREPREPIKGSFNQKIRIVKGVLIFMTILVFRVLLRELLKREF